MSRTSASEVIEALGACLIVLGLVFWSLPVALIVAGFFLIALANAAGVTPNRNPSARGDSRAAS